MRTAFDQMEEESEQLVKTTTYQMEEQPEPQESEPKGNSVYEPLLETNRTLSSIPLAMIGAKVSHIESLDYEINENDLFKHDWRSRSDVQVLQYTFVKWLQAFLVGLLTGVIATLINLAVENIAGYKLLAVFHYIKKQRFVIDFILYQNEIKPNEPSVPDLCRWGPGGE